MKYSEFVKLAPEARKVYLYDRVEMIVRSLSELHETFNGCPIGFERESDDEGLTVRLVIKCPYQTVAWFVCLIIEHSSTLEIVMEGSTVYVR